MPSAAAWSDPERVRPERAAPEAAQDRLEAAETRRAVAMRRYRYAPKGEAQSRLAALQRATEDALRAALSGDHR